MPTTIKKQDNDSEEPSSIAAPKRIDHSWVLIAKDSLLENTEFCFISLPHPAHGKPTKYCLDGNNKKMYEFVTFNEPHRCWFTDQVIKLDASVLMMTPINPILIVLPRLKDQSSKRAIPLEDLLSEKGFDKIIDFIPHLDQVADLKGPQELKAYRYNEEKTLTWLVHKVKKLAQLLKTKNVHVTSGATSATFVASNISNDNIDEEFFVKYAYGIISEYLEEDLLSQLEKKFDFKPDLIESLGKKRKSEVAESNNKRTKCEQMENDGKEYNMTTFIQESNDAKKSKPLTAKEKARQRAASGTKTISAFFAKK